VHRRRRLPDDLLREASLRLAILAIVVAAIWAAGTALTHVTANAARISPPPALTWIAIASIVASLLVFAYARSPHRNANTAVNLGLGYMIFTAFALGLVTHLGPHRANGSLSPTISWAGVVILIVAAILPTTKPKMLAAGLIAVSMNPIAMLLARANGQWDFNPPSLAIVMHYPDVLLVGVALVISHVVTSLGRRVADARAMGSYRLEELLGRGGMGEVYRASHRLLARPAAIKLIRPEMLGGTDTRGTGRAIERFRREAEAAAMLRSPHTVDIYDFGVTDDRRLYLVMELLEGMDLEKLVERHGPMPAPRVVHVLRQVCDSLDEAHALGMTHRDIKPANIHLGRVGRHQDVAKVLDFGLARLAESETQRSTVTLEGVILGTPAYMAPEMATGGPMDARTDLYALGCVAYYLLTAEQVFTGDTIMSVVTQHVHAVPVPPSRRTELPIPTRLEEIVLACLAKQPDERPQSAARLLDWLAAIDGPVWTDEDAHRWWQRH
jgi:serine/threonine-protein kinase